MGLIYSTTQKKSFRKMSASWDSARTKNKNLHVETNVYNNGDTEEMVGGGGAGKGVGVMGEQ